MARRKEVFESKVLQKLYPASLKLEKEPRNSRSPPQVVGDLATKVHVKRKVAQEGDAEKTHSAGKPGRRMYTVLPPPADYKTESEKSITLPQLESINSDKDPAEESVQDSNEEQDQDEDEQKRKRRRRKKKTARHFQVCGKDGAAPVSESSTGRSPTPVDEGRERISKNKKRKLKKKRHKEKLLSSGLMPRATALEFTYKRDVEENDEEEERRAAEVSDFLKETMKSYMSDSLLHVDELRLLSGTVEELLSSIASGCKPASVLNQLISLKAFVQQRQTDEVETALKELYNTSSLSAEETAAVVSLFQYWITDILPMQRDEKTQLPTMQSL